MGPFPIPSHARIMEHDKLHALRVWQAGRPYFGTLRSITGRRFIVRCSNLIAARGLSISASLTRPWSTHYISDTLERLARMRTVKAGDHTTSILRKLDHFGDNPGALAAWQYAPAQLPSSPALVVVLHGCTQTAAGYDAGSGWSALAEDYGFVVLFPEQVRQNNANLCFNWFDIADTRRDQGEAMSIRQMIAAMVAKYDVDEQRIYITGLSP